MAKKLFLILLFLLVFLSIPKSLLFYDSPEYLNLAKQNLAVGLTKGHMPVHPFFILFFHIFIMIVQNIGLNLEYASNILAFLFMAISACLFYKTASLLLTKKKSYISLLVFLFLPAVYTIGSNMLIESFLFLLYLLGFWILFKLPENKKYLKTAFILTGIAMILTHVESIIWILSYPAVFAVLSEKKIVKKYIKKIIFCLFVQISVGCVLYFITVLIIGRPNFGQPYVILSRQFFESLTLLGLARSLRNSVLIHLSAMGSGVLGLLILKLILVTKDSKSKYQIMGISLLFILSLISSLHWMGDYMPRRIIFVLPAVSIFITRELKKNFILLLSYQFILWIGIWNFYLKGDFAIERAARVYKDDRYKNAVSTQYLAPFTNEVNYIERKDREFFEHGGEVIIDSYALMSPYFLPAGGNLHITSVGKSRPSEGEKILDNKCFDIVEIPKQSPGKRPIYFGKVSDVCTLFEERIQNLESMEKRDYLVLIGKTLPNKTVFVYSNLLSDRILKGRADYSDPILWLSYLILGKKDPIAWAISDREGIFEIALKDYREDYTIYSDSQVFDDPVVVIK